VLAKMVREGLTEKVESDRVVKFKFENMGKLPPPVLQFVDVTFGYSPDKVLYSHVDLGADLDSRVAVVSRHGRRGYARACVCGGHIDFEGAGCASGGGSLGKL
jgi:ATP-binding cassette subfamily F protein 2